MTGLRDLLDPCRMCPRECGAARLHGDLGWCGAGGEPEVASACLHGGEEPVLGGDVGVGNIFLAHCNMRCIFCQNHQISQTDRRFPWTVDRLADELLGFQDAGCPTVGLVSPTHYAAQLAEAVRLARDRGLSTPLVWNSNGYDSVEVLRLLDGLVDIYLPDFKYASEESAECSGTPGYAAAARAALTEMYSQKGPLVTGPGGTAVRGLMVRHLVLPNDMARTREVLEFVSRALPGVPVSLMSQYNPVHLARAHPLLSRRLREREYASAVACLEEFGLTRGYVQDWRESPAAWLPDFDSPEPFSGKGR